MSLAKLINGIFKDTTLTFMLIVIVFLIVILYLFWSRYRIVKGELEYLQEQSGRLKREIDHGILVEDDDDRRNKYRLTCPESNVSEEEHGLVGEYYNPNTWNNTQYIDPTKIDVDEQDSEDIGDIDMTKLLHLNRNIEENITHKPLATIDEVNDEEPEGLLPEDMDEEFDIIEGNVAMTQQAGKDDSVVKTKMPNSSRSSKSKHIKKDYVNEHNDKKSENKNKHGHKGKNIQKKGEQPKFKVKLNKTTLMKKISIKKKDKA